MVKVNNSKKNINTGNMSPRNSNVLPIYILFLIVVPIFLYFRVIDYSFSNLDDSSLITDHFDRISNIENLPKALTTDAFFSHQSSFYRPLQTISFMIDSQISDKNPSAYHATNLVLHVIVVLVLFLFLIKLGIKREISFLLALIYSVHPMLTNAVCWIPAQGDLYLSLSGLSAFIMFINYYTKKRTGYLILHAILFLFACLAKETALVFPFMFIIYFYYFVKNGKSWKDILPYPFIWAGIFLIYFLLRSSAITINNPSSISGIQAFVKNLPTIPIIFGKIIIPMGLTTMPLFDNVSVIIGLCLLVISSILLVKCKAYRNHYVIFGILWFLGFIIPPMYYRMRLAEFSSEYFEHRAGLPVIGLIIITGILLNTLPKKSFRNIVYIIVPILFVYTSFAFIHSKDYSDRMTFSNAAINSNANNAFALTSRGCEYMNAGNNEQAMADFESAIKVCRFYSSPYYNKGVMSHIAGNTQKAEFYYSLALKYDTLLQGVNYISYPVYYNLAWEKMELKKYNEAIILLKRTLVEYPSNGDLYNNLGSSYFSISGYDSALYYYSKALDIQPNSALYLSNRGGVKYFIKDYKGALIDYEKALEADQNDADLWFHAGNTKMELNDIEGAITDLSRVILIQPTFGEAYYRRGLAYLRANKKAESEKDMSDANKLGFKKQ